MFTQLLSKEKDLYVVSVIGEDQVGLVSEVTQLLFEKGLNIIDIEQTVIHSQFTMVLLLQPLRRQFRLNVIRKELQHLAKRRKMNITVTPLREFRGLRLAETKKPYVLTIVGSDRPGVVAAVSSTLAELRCNIERIKMIARGEFLGMEMWIDLRNANFSLLRDDFSEVARRTGMDIIVQPESTFRNGKR